MNPPIILTTFGTSSSAQETYDQIESEVSQRLPEHPLYRAYTSRRLIKKLAEQQGKSLSHPLDLVRQLRLQGNSRIIVQSLHLFAGSEFHSLNSELRGDRDICTIGRAAFTTPDDFAVLRSLLRPVIEKKKDHAVLIIGHGTQHPVWTVFPALEHMLQEYFGPHLFVGTVEHYPDTTGLEHTIRSRGYKQVYMIPLFLVAGLHYRRDMMGDHPESWKSRLEQAGLEVDGFDTGLGGLPGFSRLVCAHIVDALNAARQDSD